MSSRVSWLMMISRRTRIFFFFLSLVFGNVGILTAWACEILQEVVFSHPSKVNWQNLPGNGNGLELPAAFWHRLRHSVSFSTDSQVVTCILHVAACGRFRWFSGYLTLSPTFKLIQATFLLQERGCRTSPSKAISQFKDHFSRLIYNRILPCLYYLKSSVRGEILISPELWIFSSVCFKWFLWNFSLFNVVGEWSQPGHWTVGNLGL